MRNEESYIPAFLVSIMNNDYPLEFMELIILDGASSDRSIEIINEFKQNHQTLDIKVIQNPKITIPNALNLGVRNASNPIIVRMDCHAEYDSAYIERSVNNLLTLPNATGIGGVITPAGKTNTGQAIAMAISSKFGNGGASYRVTPHIVPSDTIWCGCWRRDDAIAIGLFDSEKEANEDFEFNQRLKTIGVIYTCPDVRATQYVRESFTDLYYQYSRYGYWKAIVVKEHPNTLTLRQLIPLVFFISLTISIALTNITIWPISLLLTTYLTAILCAPATLSPSGLFQYLKTSLALCVMHFAWASGFIKGLLTPKPKTP